MTYLIACGHKKADGAALARDFYTGRPTQRVLAQAEAMGRTFILSAVHGLVDPDSTIARPYDRKLDDLTPAEKRAWLVKVRRQLRARGIDPADITYVGSAPTYRRAVEALKAAA